MLLPLWPLLLLSGYAVALMHKAMAAAVQDRPPEEQAARKAGTALLFVALGLVGVCLLLLNLRLGGQASYSAVVVISPLVVVVVCACCCGCCALCAGAAYERGAADGGGPYGVQRDETDSAVGGGGGGGGGPSSSSQPASTAAAGGASPPRTAMEDLEAPGQDLRGAHADSGSGLSGLKGAFVTGGSKQAGAADRYATMSIKQLKAEVKRRGIDLSTRGALEKSELIALLQPGV